MGLKPLHRLLLEFSPHKKKQEILGSDPTGLQPLQATKIYHPESMDTQNDGHI